MKKLILLLFIPFISFSQTYKDVMSIKTLDTFKKVAIENDYRYEKKDSLRGLIRYVNGELYKPSGQGSWVAKKMLYYHLKDDGFNLIVRAKDEKKVYDEIFDDVKNKCSFYKIINYKGDEYACYSCPESSYKGKIGFRASVEWRYIKLFPNE